MVEALRGLGYSPATAIADVIDNSVSAGAKTVHIQFGWAQADSFILIVDDGAGMSEPELDVAMRLGEKSPLDSRDASDLGRFGLGLKTASFSQCRRLTVLGRQAGEDHVLRWDLDVLLNDKRGRWSLLEGIDPESGDRLRFSDSRASGTAVLWEKLDRIVSPQHDEQEFLDVMDGVERHLGMVFHRYIDGRKLRIILNGRPVRAWDPFLEGRLDTWRSGEDRFSVNGSLIRAQGFVLPHRDRLDVKSWESAAGPHGWTAQQGFYVYRNERLLLAGSWLGLGRGRSWTKDEPYRLARIRVDIPNQADADWKIDIRKATARPPVEARPRLTVLAEDVRARARRVFAFRGSPKAVSKGGPIAQAWRADHTKDGVRYRIDLSHPAIAAVLEDSGIAADTVRSMLHVIEQTVPIQQIWLDTAEAKDTPKAPLADDPPPEVIKLIERVFSGFVHRKGLSIEQARAQLMRTEPFDGWPTYIATLDLRSENRP